ncbi:MAG: hypothetical protein H2174_10975 [Vampirovibrio sp.]|jgi:hypothetical protein|nr:hypothetical protein [Vampirovibrio sp.]
MKKPTKNTHPTTIEALAKTMVATTAATEKFQAVVYTLRKSLGLNSSVKDKAVDANWTNQLLGLLRLIEGVESTKNSAEIRLAYQQRLLGSPNESRSGELFEFRENYKLFLRQSARDIPRDLEKFFDALQEAIEQAV